VPRDVQEAVAAVTGQRPAEVTVRRGPLVNRTAARIAADSYATDGVVHLPGTAPLTTDRSRRLLAHELTHVVQQKSGTAPRHEMTPAGRAAEEQAMRAEAAFSAPRAPAAPQASAATGLPSAPSVARAVGGLTASLSQAPAPPTGRNGRPAVSRSTSAAAADRAAALPRTSPQRPASATFVPLALNAQASTQQGAPAGTADAAPVLAAAPGQVAHAPAPGTPSPSPATTGPSGHSPSLPTITHQAPAAPPGLPSPSSPQSSPTQRRASHRSDPPGQGGDRGGKNGPAPSPASPAPSPRTTQPENLMDTATDDLWLQRHALALYPHLKQMLRNEFLLDRERRGRLMRDD